MRTNRYERVWDALENIPGEAENLRLRSLLMRELATHLRSSGETQEQAAIRLSVSQPRISDLLRGKIDKFSVNSLVNMLAACGLALDIRGVVRSIP